MNTEQKLKEILDKVGKRSYYNYYTDQIAEAKSLDELNEIEAELDLLYYTYDMLDENESDQIYVDLLNKQEELGGTVDKRPNATPYDVFDLLTLQDLKDFVYMPENKVPSKIKGKSKLPATVFHATKWQITSDIINNNLANKLLEYTKQKQANKFEKLMQTHIFNKAYFDSYIDSIRNDHIAAMQAENATHKCLYCGKTTYGANEDLLCDECYEMFGHTHYSQL